MRIGYYTQRRDGWFCFGSQYAPMMTLVEARILFARIAEKRWLDD
jgi:hypothetical protein